MNSNAIFNISSSQEFRNIALQIFTFQFDNNSVYQGFCKLLQKTPKTVKTIEDIPFLPIQFFKTHQIVSSSEKIVATFLSSGTTGKQSKHSITDLSIYQKSFSKGFEYFYDSVKNYTILALLPSYAAQKNSSLIYMVNELIKQSENLNSGFFLNNQQEVIKKLTSLDADGKKIMLIGVSFALLDLIEQHQFQLKNTIIMETGGMKGRRKEIIRVALHQKLCNGFGVSNIHSEYGMTELLSQAYSQGNGIFKCPPWMKIFIREPEDALNLQVNGKTGGINIIDLANINSCSFIATQDLGRVYENETFEVLGRFDDADIRGCNLMAI